MNCCVMMIKVECIRFYTIRVVWWGVYKEGQQTHTTSISASSLYLPVFSLLHSILLLQQQSQPDCQSLVLGADDDEEKNSIVYH